MQYIGFMLFNMAVYGYNWGSEKYKPLVWLSVIGLVIAYLGDQKNIIKVGACVTCNPVSKHAAR